MAGALITYGICMAGNRTPGDFYFSSSGIIFIKSFHVVSVAFNTLFNVSNVGHLGIWVRVKRLHGLNVVGFKPARRAMPDSDSPFVCANF